jgi:5-methylcytosine-specific restriction endonuclease McrA
MIFCKRCNGRMFVDRQYSNVNHLETFCMLCGSRNFFHPPSESERGRWLLQKEKSRASSTITTL